MISTFPTNQEKSNQYHCLPYSKFFTYRLHSISTKSENFRKQISFSDGNHTSSSPLVGKERKNKVENDHDHKKNISANRYNCSGEVVFDGEPLEYLEMNNEDRTVIQSLESLDMKNENDKTNNGLQPPSPSISLPIITTTTTTSDTTSATTSTSTADPKHLPLPELQNNETNFDFINITVKNTTQFRPKTYFQHSPEVRQKISLANKGRSPWNVGKQHSEETRRKIAQRNIEIAYSRKVQKATALNVTLEEYEKIRRKTNRENGRLKKAILSAMNTNVTTTTKFKEAKNSTKNNDYKRYSRKGIAHTEETRKLLSEKTKQLWQERYHNLTLGLLGANATSYFDINGTFINGTADYPTNFSFMFSKRTTSPETRAKLSAIMKERHYNRTLLAANFTNDQLLPGSWRNMNETWRKLLSEKMKEKWNDPDYVIKVRQGIIDRHYTNKPISAKSRRNLLNKIFLFYPNTTILSLAGPHFWEQERQKISNLSIRDSENTTLVEEAMMQMFQIEKQKNNLFKEKKSYSYPSSSSSSSKKRSEDDSYSALGGMSKKQSRSTVITDDMDDETKKRRFDAKEFKARARRNRRQLEKLLETDDFEIVKSVFPDEEGNDSNSEEDLLEEDSKENKEKKVGEGGDVSQSWYDGAMTSRKIKKLDQAVIRVSSDSPKLRKRLKEKMKIQIDDNEFYQDDYGEEFEYYYDEEENKDNNNKKKNNAGGGEGEAIAEEFETVSEDAVALDAVESTADDLSNNEFDTDEEAAAELLRAKPLKKIVEEEEDETGNPLPYFIEEIEEEDDNMDDYADDYDDTKQKIRQGKNELLES